MAGNQSTIDQVTKSTKYIHRIVDLNGGPISETLPAMFYDGENASTGSHMFIIELRQNGEKLSNYNYTDDSVSGLFLNAKNQTVAINNRVKAGCCRYLSDDVAIVVTLPTGCYAVEGPFTLTLSLSGTVVYEFHSYIKLRSSDEGYDPNAVIHNLNELYAEINNMASATVAANAAATAAAAVAENMDIDMTEQTGSATITITRPDGTQKMQTINVTTDDASTDLIYDERFLNNGQYVVTASDMESGTWSYSSKMNNTKRLRNRNLIPVSAGMQIAYSNPTLKVVFSVLPNKTSGAYSQLGSWIAPGGSGVVNITQNGYLVFLCESANDSDITVNDYDCSVVISTAEYAACYKVHYESLQVYDANEFTDPGTYGINSGLAESNYLNFPNESNPEQYGGTIINVKMSTSGRFFRQYYFHSNNSIIYTRYKTATGFREWTKIDLTNIDYLNGDLLTQKNVIAPFDMNYTREGMTFTASKADPNVITLNGTWNGTSICFVNIFAHSSPVQVLQADTCYYIHLDKSAEDNNLCVELFSSDEHQVETKIGRFTKSDFVKIPDDAATCLLRVRYLKSGVQVTNLKITVKMLELSDVSYGVYGKGTKHIIQNKKIALFGDSIMSGSIQSEGGSTHCCSEYLQNELNIEVVDYAYGSVGYITHAYRAKNILELAKMTDLTGCTYFVCSAGDNDYQYPIGNYDDTNSQFDDYEALGSGATIIGNLYKLVVYLHETYPNMTIIIVDKPNATKSAANSVWPTYRRTDGNWVKQLNDTFKEFCEYYGCAHISLDNMGADPWLLEQLLGHEDYIHWTRLGYQKLMLYIAGEIRKYTGQGDYYTQYVNPVWEKYANIVNPS